MLSFQEQVGTKECSTEKVENDSGEKVSILMLSIFFNNVLLFFALFPLSVLNKKRGNVL